MTETLATRQKNSWLYTLNHPKILKLGPTRGTESGMTETRAASAAIAAPIAAETAPAGGSGPSSAVPPAAACPGAPPTCDYVIAMTRNYVRL